MGNKKLSKTSSSTGERDEANTFLADSKEALNQKDYFKSFMSLKNAYMLDPKLKKEINKLIVLNKRYVGFKVSTGRCFYKKDFERIEKYGKLYLDILVFYREINGFYLASANATSFISMQKEMADLYRTYQNKCIKEEVYRLKHKYNYKNKPKGSKEYFINYTNYLSELYKWVNIYWTSEYWLTYFAPDFLNYVKEVSALDKKSRSQFKYCAMVNRIRARNSAGDFSPKTHNMMIEICENMFNSPVLEWKWIAKIQLEALGSDSSIYLKFYSVKGILKNKNYEFSKQIAKYAIGASKKDRIICNKILERCGNNTLYHYVYIDGKLNTDFFTILVKTGFHNPVRNFIKNVQTNFRYGPYNKKTYKILQYMQYEKLAKIIDLYGNKSAKLYILGNLRMRITNEKKRLGIKNNKSDFDVFLKKNVNVLTKTSGHRGPFPSIIGSLQEDNVVYTAISNWDFTSTYLAKTDLSNNNFKTIIGKALSPKLGRYSGGASRSPLCISPKYIAYVTHKSQVILYPKNGDKPEEATFEGLSGRTVSNVFYGNGKFYILTDSFMAHENKRPFEIIAFDIKNKSFELIFSAGQEKDNPLKEYSLIYMLHGKLFFDQKTNNVIVPLTLEKGRRSKDGWQKYNIVTSFNVVSKKWKFPEIYKSDCDPVSLYCINEDIIIERSYPSFYIIDHSKFHNAIKKIAKNYGIKQILYEKGIAKIKFKIKKTKSSRRKYTSCTGINDSVMYNHSQVMFFKQGMIMNYISYNQYQPLQKHLDFDYKNKTYSIYSILNKKTKTMKLYVGEYKSAGEMLKGKKKDNSITYRAGIFQY